MRSTGIGKPGNTSCRALRSGGWPVGYTTPAMSIWERNGLRWRDAKWRSTNVDRDGVRVRYPGRVPSLLHRWPALDRIIMRRHARVVRVVDRERVRERADRVCLPSACSGPTWKLSIRVASCITPTTDSPAMPGSGPEIAGFERALCERADRIFAITPGVAQRASPMRREQDRARAQWRRRRSLRARVPKPGARAARRGSATMDRLRGQPQREDRLRPHQSARVRAARHPLAADRPDPRRGAVES